ncbi:MAG: hypothetical protein [Circular genetic element sp.]|nr:MAG: hypothetical protein [Circular genetic element sp.]
MRRPRTNRKRRTKRNFRPRRRGRRRTRRGQSSNQLSLYRGMLPKTAYIKHRYNRTVRLDEDFILPEMTTSGIQDYPCVLIASCNNPMAPLNQQSATGVASFDTSPAFIGNNTGASSLATWSTNRYPMLWQFFQRMYSQWTVVGSRIVVTYRPDDPPGLLAAESNSGPFQITMVMRQTQTVIGTTGTTFPIPNSYPQLVTDQPGAYSKMWSVNDLFSKKQVSMSRNFSARRQFGKARGNVVAEENLQGAATATPSPGLAVGGNVPQEQYYWQLYINAVTSPAGSGTVLPKGTFDINIEYGTVWTERATLPDS